MDKQPILDSKLLDAIRLFDAEEVSLGYAAQMAEMSRAEFITLLAQQNIPVVRTTLEEIVADVDGFLHQPPNSR
jgi:predicted HTH domain antitoxin